MFTQLRNLHHYPIPEPLVTPEGNPHGWRLLLPAPARATTRLLSLSAHLRVPDISRRYGLQGCLLSLSTWNMQEVVFEDCPPPPSSSKSSFVASPFRAGVSFLLPLPLGWPRPPQHLVEATQCHHIPVASDGPRASRPRQAASCLWVTLASATEALQTRVLFITHRHQLLQAHSGLRSGPAWSFELFQPISSGSVNWQPQAGQPSPAQLSPAQPSPAQPRPAQHSLAHLSPAQASPAQVLFFSYRRTRFVGWSWAVREAHVGLGAEPRGLARLCS